MSDRRRWWPALLALGLAGLVGCSAPGRPTPASAAPEPASAMPNASTPASAMPDASDAASDMPDASAPASPAPTPFAAPASPAPVAVRMRFPGGEALLELLDNPTAASLVNQLPLTLPFEDFHGQEKIATPSRALSVEGAPQTYDPAPGDVTCYGPWGNLALSLIHI